MKRARSKHLFSRKRKQSAAGEPHCPAPGTEEVYVNSFGTIITEGLRRFEEHYRPQCLADGSEWAKLAHSLRQPLPVAFRVSKEAWSQLEHFHEELKDGCTTAWGRFVPAPRYFPFSRTMSLGCDAKTLRQEQMENPKSALSQLGQWLTKSSAEGRISRQEVVSTVPVAVLRLEPHHVVLDLCAAPGSKTLQALELAGAVIANELSASRACVLARRCTLQERAASLAVVQHKAQTFPGPCGDKTRGFDRIICDVPCSGDGTMRKHPEKWRSWSPHLGRELHSRQLQIALRAMALLKVGGLMTYSTCSFNPLENEAVVAALLLRTGAVLEVVPDLQGLPTRPGLTTWTVEELHGPEGLTKAQRKRFRRSMWPPDCADLHLERCVRCLPFLANTGGFFVALLRKEKPWPTECERRPTPTLQSIQGSSSLQFLDQVPQDVTRDLGIPTTLDTGSLVQRGANKLFYCSDHLVSALQEREKPLSVIAVGTCAFRFQRSLGPPSISIGRQQRNNLRRGKWFLTKGADSMKAVKLRKETNATAAKKILEGHTCSVCGLHRHGSLFSRKMLTRPPSKRKCSDCMAKRAPKKCQCCRVSAS
ncbi:unnamed protein product [Durusdinium trenchii]|uniref:SAM-dependent MTase RsmB/NOP-type domain-containing protein n=1 Tax=Durusdinium trenchii TaxID=1381693 RepID=A0ABP0SU26_9DINO